MYVHNQFMYMSCPYNHENSFVNTLFVMNFNKYNEVIHDCDPKFFW